MKQHEQLADALTLYLLGELSGEDRAAMERHLGACGDCRAELRELQESEALIALTSPQATPPARARARLMSAIAREPRIRVVSGGLHARPWWFWIPAVATLALAIAVGVLWHDNVQLSAQADQLAALEAQQDLDATKTKEMVADMTANGAIHLNLTEAGAPPQPHGKATYNPKDGGVVFIASNLTPLPAGQTYQLWIVPANDTKPIPAARFKPSARGTAVVMKHDPFRVRPKMFAVTVEPEQGAGLPNYPAVLVSSAGE